MSFRGADGEVRPGAASGDEVVDLSSLAPTMLALLQRPDGLVAARSLDGPRVTLADVMLTAPIARPPKFLAIG